MIVECQNCSTRFQLDDSRVPADGVRVRCSRCKESFFLPSPKATPEEAAAAIASEAAAHSGILSPGSTQDLTQQALSESALASDNCDDEDWEFSDAVPGLGADDEPEDLGGLFCETPFSESSDEESGLDLADDDSPPQSEPLPSDPEPEEAGSDGIEVHSGEVTVDPAPDGAPHRSDFGDPADYSSLSADDDFEQADDSAAVEIFSSDDLDDPENWNLFEDIGEPEVAAPVSEAAPRATVARAAADPLAGLADAGRATDALVFEAGSGIGAIGDALSGVRIAGQVLGWLALVGLVCAGLGYGLFADLALRAAPAPLPVVSIAGLRAEDLEASWVDSARSGPLLLVRGLLRNPGRQAVAPGGQLQLALLDATGIRLEREPTAVGLVIPADQLQSASPERLADASRLAAERLGRGLIPAGGAVAFQAIVSEVPEAAARFELLEHEATTTPTSALLR